MRSLKRQKRQKIIVSRPKITLNGTIFPHEISKIILDFVIHYNQHKDGKSYTLSSIARSVCYNWWKLIPKLVLNPLRLIKEDMELKVNGDLISYVLERNVKYVKLLEHNTKFKDKFIDMIGYNRIYNLIDASCEFECIETLKLLAREPKYFDMVRRICKRLCPEVVPEINCAGMYACDDSDGEEWIC